MADWLRPGSRTKPVRIVQLPGCGGAGEATPPRLVQSVTLLTRQLVITQVCVPSAALRATIF